MNLKERQAMLRLTGDFVTSCEREAEQLKEDGHEQASQAMYFVTALASAIHCTIEENADADGE